MKDNQRCNGEKEFFSTRESSSEQESERKLILFNNSQLEEISENDPWPENKIILVKYGTFLLFWVIYVPQNINT